MSEKSVYIFNFYFDAYSIKVNIPNFYDYPAIHEARLAYRADRGNQEKLHKQKELSKNGVQIEDWNHRYEKYEIMPDSLWLEGYTDREEPSPHELIFGIINGGIVVRKPLADILNKHRLGQTTLTPVQIYDYNTRQLWSDEVFYFLNICEKREFACIPQSHDDFSLSMNKNLQKLTYGFVIPMYDGHVEIHRQALDCDVDLWYDPLLDKLFMSSALYDDLKGIGLRHGSYSYGRFRSHVFECKLI